MDASVCHADGSIITVEELDSAYQHWVHTGRNFTISQCDSRYAQQKINDPNVYPISKHIRGRVVLICNAGYQSLRLFKDLFIQMKYKVGIFTEKTSEFMHETVREEARREENRLVDSFVVVIYGIPDGFDLQQIVDALHPSNAKHLQNKPKLVYLVGPYIAARQVEELSRRNSDPDLLVGATGFHGLMLVIYVFCAYVHELSAQDIWRLILQYAEYHDFKAATHCTLRKECYFFPGVSQSALPEELAGLDPRDVGLYRKLLDQESVKTYNIRLMFVGLFGAGKTSTARRMMGHGIAGITSTDGIDVYIGKCRVDLATGRWETLTDSSRCKPLSRLAHKLNAENADSTAETMEVEMQHIESVKKRPRLERHGRQTSTESSDHTDFSFAKLDLRSSSGTSSFEKVESFDEEIMHEKEPEQLNIEALCTAQKVLKEASETKGRTGEVAVVSLWDFAGQFIYYATHQLFFSPRCIYLLVLDMEKEPEKAVDQWYMDLQGVKAIETQGAVNFWLGSIYTYAKGRQPGVPPIILVGTHKDKLSGNDEEKEKYARKYFKKIRDIFYESPIASLISDEDILLDNSIEDSNIDRLKEVILDVSKGMYYWGEDYPAKWIELEQALDDRREDGTNFISFQELQTIDGKLTSPLKTEAHLKLFLRVHHEMGSLIYFEDSPILRDVIILQPQWIINAFRHLIRSDDFDWKYGELQRQWHTFKESGRLDISLAQNIWSQDNTNHFYENYDKLLEILEKLDIIVKARRLNEDGMTTTALGFYHVPCLLTEKPPTEIFDMRKVDNAVTTPVLCFEFRLKFVPPAVYNRVIALCLGRWPLARQGKNLLLYCGWSVFEVKEANDEDRHRLHVFFKRSKIGLRLVRYSTKNKVVDPLVCERVRRFVSSAIRKEFKRFDPNHFTGAESSGDDYSMDVDPVEDQYMKSFPFKYSIQCLQTDNDHFLDDGLHDADDLKREFEENAALEAEIICTQHSGCSPHAMGLLELLQDWFPEKIPRSLLEKLQIKTTHELWLDRFRKKRHGYLKESHLSAISPTIGKNWEMLMHELDLQKVDMDQAKENHPGNVNRQKFEVLKMWNSKQQMQSNVTCVVSLVTAMTRCSNVNIDWDTVRTVVESIEE